MLRDAALRNVVVARPASDTRRGTGWPFTAAAPALEPLVAHLPSPCERRGPLVPCDALGVGCTGGACCAGASRTARAGPSLALACPRPREGAVSPRATSCLGGCRAAAAVLPAWVRVRGWRSSAGATGVEVAASAVPASASSAAAAISAATCSAMRRCSASNVSQRPPPRAASSTLPPRCSSSASCASRDSGRNECASLTGGTCSPFPAPPDAPECLSPAPVGELVWPARNSHQVRRSRGPCTWRPASF